MTASPFKADQDTRRNGEVLHVYKCTMLHMYMYDLYMFMYMYVDNKIIGWEYWWYLHVPYDTCLRKMLSLCCLQVLQDKTEILSV